jgi:hypothetical protein
MRPWTPRVFPRVCPGIRSRLIVHYLIVNDVLVYYSAGGPQ